MHEYFAPREPSFRSKIVIVADRRLNSKGNLELIREVGYGYIMACRLRSMPKEIQDKAVDEADYIPLSYGFKYKSIEYENCFKDSEKNTHRMDESIIPSWSCARAADSEQPSKRGGEKYLTDKSDRRSKLVLDESKIVTDAKANTRAFYDVLSGIYDGAKARKASSGIQRQRTSQLARTNTRSSADDAARKDYDERGDSLS